MLMYEEIHSACFTAHLPTHTLKPIGYMFYRSRFFGSFVLKRLTYKIVKGYLYKKKVVFIAHLVDANKQDAFASFRAKNETLTKLFNLTNAMEK